MLGQFDDDSVEKDSPKVKNVNYFFSISKIIIIVKSNITLTASDRICRRPALCVQT